ncbi:MAG: ABC transporter permease [Candidatus Hydrogenedentes bacterium]|nr:ABC transporter permease [Candidatus Hydrogenedentota bacterium]
MKSKSEGYWTIAWRQFRRRKLAMAGLALVLVLGVIAIAAPLITNDRPIVMIKDGHISFPALQNEMSVGNEDFSDAEFAIFPPFRYTPTQYSLSDRLEPPSAKHPFGTDDRGRDVLSRMIYGTRVSLSVGFVAVAIYITIGTILGAIAGYFGGITDMIISRLIEIMICFPVFFLIIAVIAFLPPSIYNIMVVIGVTGWTGVARLVRAEFLKLKNRDFMTAARALGASHMRIMFRHALRNAFGPVFVSATFGVAGAILTESALSFLGFGVPPPTPSWGDILSQSRQYIEFAWWLTIFPGMAIFLTITAYNLVGEGLRDATDPRLRE